MEPRTDQQSGRRRILVVDGDAQIQRLLDVNLRTAGFDVQTVATATEALAALTASPADLVVAETKFTAGADGFELCRQIKAAGAAAPAVVFLAEQSVEAKVKSVEAGADDFLAKPVYVQEVVARARALLQRRERDRLEALARGDERFVGDIEVLPLVDLLRAIEANRRSGVAHLAAPSGARGDIYFRDGSVVDAEVGRLSGLDALCRLFSWAQGAFEVEWKSIRRKDAVAMEPGALIMEALRRLDDWRRLLAELPAEGTIFEVDYHLLAERLAEIPDEVNSILRLFDGQRTLMRVVDDCGFADLDALAVIGKLYREQIIRDVRARPETTVTPGADIEGWIADAVGPFRGVAPRERRDLFGVPMDANVSVHARVTAPVEPLDEAARDVVADERRERFTDRLIAEGDLPPEGAAPTPVPAASSAPNLAPETTRMGLAPAPPVTVPAAPASIAPGPTTAPMPTVAPPRLAPETTTMGLPPAPAIPLVTVKAPPPPEPLPPATGLSNAPLSTKPGFEAAAAPPPEPPRAARAMSIDEPPPVRLPEGSGPKRAEGIPQPVAAQRPELIVSPSPSAMELQATVGEIMARASTDLMEARTTAGAAARRTDLGLGPEPRTEAKGELAASPSREVAPIAPKKKIILDADMPDVSDDDAAPRSSSAAKLLIVGICTVAVFGGGLFAINRAGRRHGGETRVDAGASNAPAAATAIATTSDAAAASDAGADTATSPALAEVPHAHPTGAHKTGDHEVLDERMADPKVARALPSEFQQLLSACRTAFGEKRAKDAELACTAAKDANPDSPEACALLGHALFNRKKRHEALQWAERAVELDANQADAYVIIGGVKQQLDDPHGAKAAYKKYLELAPDGQYAADLRALVDSL
ncbi:MAG TPA: DUF4388 domain-containing protein [Polyangia bacterium]|nr:DUF4388 domain-containing protein [Polyangia bacterium]